MAKSQKQGKPTCQNAIFKEKAGRSMEQKQGGEELLTYESHG